MQPPAVIGFDSLVKNRPLLAHTTVSLNGLARGDPYEYVDELYITNN